MPEKNPEELAVDLKKALRQEALLQNAKEEDLNKISEKVAKEVDEITKETSGENQIQPPSTQETDRIPKPPTRKEETGVETVTPGEPKTETTAPQTEEGIKQQVDQEPPTRAGSSNTDTSTENQDYQPFSEETPPTTEDETDNQPGEVEPTTSPQETEKQTATSLKSQQRKEQVEKERAAGDNFDINAFTKQEELNLDDNVTGDPRKVAAGKIGESLGKELSQRIATGSFKAFALAMIMALIKDVGDLSAFIDAGVITSIVMALLNIVISAALLAIIGSQTGWMKMQIQKLFIQRFIGAIAIEFLPYGEIVPVYTIMILLIKRHADRERRKNERSLRKLEAQMKNISSTPTPKGSSINKVSADVRG